MPAPFETIVVPGYIIAFDYHDGSPPTEIRSVEHSYHDGYIEMTITVTKDNLSVCERVDTMFFVAPEEFEGHETIKHERGTTFPLVYGERISGLIFSGSYLDLMGEAKDCDCITIMVNSGGLTDYDGAVISMAHDKEDVLKEFAAHE